MTVTAETINLAEQDHKIIIHCCDVLRRACEGAWRASECIVFAMAVLRSALENVPAARQGRDDMTVAVLCAAAAAEHLIAIIRRDCGDHEAAYVQEGDD